MNLARIEAIVNAVLYEGYILYPYRPSSVKNRQRWTFGGVYPPGYTAIDKSSACTMQTECLLRGDDATAVEVHVRFLHLVRRELGVLAEPVAELPAEPDFVRVPSLTVGEQRFHAWEEAVERDVAAPSLTIGELRAGTNRIPFGFAGERTIEPLREPDGRVAGVMIRTSASLDGALTIAAREVAPTVFRLTVRVENLTQSSVSELSRVYRNANQKPPHPASVLTDLAALSREGRGQVEQADGSSTSPLAGPMKLPKEVASGSPLPLRERADAAERRPGEGAFQDPASAVHPTQIDRELREEAQLRAFASTHTILGVEGGAFISLMDPPADLKEAAEACANQGTWPVLAGDVGATDTLLSSPVILYDHPEVAPESPGDLFDATEIDEILTLRILGMTDEEKREMVATDERARALLERTEALTAADMERLHGTLRNPRFASPRDAPPPKPELAFLHMTGRDLKVGDLVRLRPKPGADAMDIVLKDELAVIEAIERDFEDRVHVAVVLEADPGREFGLERMPGHRFFFAPDEIEPVEQEGRP